MSSPVAMTILSFPSERISCPFTVRLCLTRNRIKDTFDDPAYYRLCGPGWDETSLYEDPAFTQYLSSKTCQGSAPSPLPSAHEICSPGLQRTEPSLEDLDPPKPPHQLTMERRSLEQRDHIGREARVRGRFAQVAEWHQSILALPELKHVSRDELPNSYAESKMWESRVLADDARGPLDYGHNAEMDIVQTLLEYPGRVKRGLAEMLEFTEACRADGLCFELGAGSDEDDEREVGEEARKIVAKYRLSDSDSVDQLTKDAEGALLRPTALFECLECGSGPHAYPEINVHWQREHWDKSVWMDHSGDSDAYGAAVWDEGIDVAERMLAVLSDKGLPEDKRHMRRLDELVGEGRVFCACGDPDMETPEEGLSWAELVGGRYTSSVGAENADQKCPERYVGEPLLHPPERQRPPDQDSDREVRAIFSPHFQNFYSIFST